MNCSRWMLASLAVLFASAAQAQGLSSGSSSGPARAYVEASVLIPHASGELLELSGGQVGRLIVGYPLVPNVDVEGVLATSLTKSDLGAGASAKLSHAIGIFLRPSMEIQPGIRAFARMGYLFPSAKYRESDGRESDTSRIASRVMSIGLGATYQVSDRLSLAGDYMRYFEFGDAWIGGFGLGVSYKF